jgi:hypothetical protein
MSKKSPLRNAVGAIVPKQPLPKDQSFAPPISRDAAPLPKGEAQAEKSTQDQNGTHPVGEFETMGEESTSDQNGTQGEKSPYPEDTNETCPTDENKSQDQKSTPDQNGTQDENGTSPSEPRLTKEERTAITLEKLRKGFTQLPNSILMDMVHGNLSKAEMKILLVIARYTVSFDGRKTAPLSKADFERYTRLQGKCILESLASLKEKNLIIKIKGDQYTSNQLGLRFDSDTSDPPPPKGPQGEEQKGTHPTGKKGTCPEDQKSTHFKESFSNIRDSLSFEFIFPSDLEERWKEFEKKGSSPKAGKERAIFLKEYSSLTETDPTLGKQFFDNCGKVISFLEEHGNGKPGEEGKVRFPMIWIQGHWGSNFAYYQKALAEQQKAKEAQAKREAQEAERKTKEQEEEKARFREEAEKQERQAKIEADTKRFLSVYRSEAEVNAFIEKAIQLSGCEFTRNSWRNQGWDSPVVRCCVLSHFLKTEVGATTVSHSGSTSEATA